MNILILFIMLSLLSFLNVIEMTSIFNRTVKHILLEDNIIKLNVSLKKNMFSIINLIIQLVDNRVVHKDIH